MNDIFGFHFLKTIVCCLLLRLVTRLWCGWTILIFYFLNRKDLSLSALKSFHSWRNWIHIIFFNFINVVTNKRLQTCVSLLRIVLCKKWGTFHCWTLMLAVTVILLLEFIELSANFIDSIYFCKQVKWLFSNRMSL